MVKLAVLETNLFLILLLPILIVMRGTILKHVTRKAIVFLWYLALFRAILPIRFQIPLSDHKRLFNSPLSDMESVRLLQSFPFHAVWVIGAILIAACIILLHVKARLEYAASLPVNCAYLDAWVEEHPSARKIRIRQLDKIDAAMTFGILKPAILLPSFTDWNNEEQLNLILLHETAHIRHCDIAAKWLMTLVVSIYWFNPFVWIMYRQLNEDLELLCDETVVNMIGNQQKAVYARTLLLLATNQRNPFLLLSPFSEKNMERRIRQIMVPKSTRKITVCLITIVLLIPLLLGFFSLSPREQTNHAASPEYIDLNADAGQNMDSETDSETVVDYIPYL